MSSFPRRDRRGSKKERCGWKKEIEGILGGPWKRLKP